MGGFGFGAERIRTRHGGAGGKAAVEGSFFVEQLGEGTCNTGGYGWEGDKISSGVVT